MERVPAVRLADGEAPPQSTRGTLCAAGANQGGGSADAAPISQIESKLS